MELNSKTANELIISGKLTIIDFSAEAWCAPCRTIGPIIDKLAEKYADKISIGKIDVDENDEIVSSFNIRNVPTILFFKDGRIVDKHVGAITELDLEQKVENLLKT